MQFNRGSTGGGDLLVPLAGYDALCINQDDVDERNTHIMRIREIHNQSLSVAAWLGEDETSNMDPNSWVENSFDNLRRYSTILEAHGRPTLEVALGIDLRAWESDYNYNGLEDFPFSSDVLYFDNEWWADSDNEEEFGPPHFRDLVALALRHLVQNLVWTRLWIIQGLAVSPTASMLDLGNASVSLQTVLTLADIFCDKVLDRSTLSSHMVNAISPCLHLLNSIGQWKRSGVLSDREDGLKSTALDDLCRLVRTAHGTLAHDKGIRIARPVYLARSRLTTSGTRQIFRLSLPLQFPLQMRIVET
jgi:hypothetical protein